MTTHRAPADPVGADLTRLLKALKLGALADTLPERAALARQHKQPHRIPRNTSRRRGIPTRIPISRTAISQGRTRPDHAFRHLDRRERPAL